MLGLVAIYSGFTQSPLPDSFNPGANGTVSSLAVQADGRILVAGNFTTLGGQPRKCIGRLNNTAPATQGLTFDGTTATWLRGGTSPEIASANFDQSVDGSLWGTGGIGRRIPGGWRVTGGSWVPGGTIRARGYVIGDDGGSGWFVESMTGAPAFGAQPSNRNNNAGTVASFNVHAGGTEPLRFQWRKDGVTLEDGGNVTGTMTPVLALSNVFGGDAGEYSVVVTNPAGSVTSAVARLTVNDPIITGQPVSQNRELGQSATLDVTALGTALNYRWYRDGVELGQGTSATFTLTNLQGHDAGLYSAVVTSPYGSVTSATALLTVNLATLDAGFNPGTTRRVYALAVQTDGKILAAGWFTVAGGQPRQRIVRLNADGTLDNGVDLELGGYDSPTVHCLTVQADGKILVGGRFTALGGQPRDNLARLKSDGTLGAAFNPGANGDVYSFVVQPDGRILLAGAFTTLAGQPRNRIARLKADRTLDTDFDPGANERVNSLALQTDGRILVGGGFTVLGGQPRNFIARLNPDGTPDPDFDPGANAEVSVLAVEAEGRILVGGYFTTLGGQPRNRIARLNADGTLDPGFDPGANSGVKSLVVQADGKILAGGAFTTLGGQVRHYLAQLNADGTVDPGFNPLTDGAYDSDVSALALQADGKVLVGGWFPVAGEQTPRGLARLNNTAPATQSLTHDGSKVTWLRGGSSPEVWRTTFERTRNNSIWTFLAAGTRIPGGWELTNVGRFPGDAIRARGDVVGGQYDGSGWFVEARLGAPVFVTQPSSRTNLAGTTATFDILARGTEPLTYQWRKDGVAVVDEGNLAGAKTAHLTMSPVLKSDEGRYRLVVSNAEGSLTSAVGRLTVIDPVIIGQPVSQRRSAGESVALSVTAAGTALNYRWRKDGLALVQATGATLWLTNLQGSDAGLYSVVVKNTYGSATSAVVELAVNLAMPEAAFEPGVDDAVWSVAVQTDGKILIGGMFTSVGDQYRSCMARLEADGKLDAGFKPGAAGLGAQVLSLVLQTDKRILVGGSFGSLAGQPRSRIARLKPDGTLGAGFNPGVGGNYPHVASVAVQADGAIVLGGSFSTLAGEARSNVARLRADGTLDAGFNLGANSTVEPLILQPDGKILLGGAFTAVAGQPRRCIARLQADGSVDAGFNPGVGGTYPYVSSMAVQADGKILVGGLFTTVAGEARSNIARLNADGTLDADFNPGASGPVRSMTVQADGKILVGGSFTRLGRHRRSCIGRLNADGTLDATFAPEASAAVDAVAVQADGKILVGGTFSLLGGQPHNFLARLHNTTPATQSLSCNGSTITWLRGGASPEVWRTTFERSTDGLTWTSLGAGTRIPGGWQLSGATLPTGGTIRARGHVAGGLHNGSAWFVETLLGEPIQLRLLRERSQVVLIWTGGEGPYRVQQTTQPNDSNSWEDVRATLQTNSMALPVGTGNLFLRVRGQ